MTNFMEISGQFNDLATLPWGKRPWNPVDKEEDGWAPELVLTQW